MNVLYFRIGGSLGILPATSAFRGSWWWCYDNHGLATSSAFIRRLFGCALLLAAPLAAETGSPALSAARAHAAMKCSVYASFSNRRDEEQRLQKLGIDEAKGFVEAMRARRVSEADFSQHVPFDFYGFFQGPSVEFIVGRLWAVAEQKAIEAIDLKSDRIVQEQSADMLFSNENCKLIR